MNIETPSPPPAVNEFAHRSLHRCISHAFEMAHVSMAGPLQISSRRLSRDRPRRAVKSIETIEMGDLVWAWDGCLGNLVRRPVTRLFRREDQPVLEVTFSIGPARKQTILCTTNHPFWVEDSGWVAASELSADDLLRRLHGRDEVRVLEVVNLGRRAVVYNFEVDGVHNYFAGAEGVLVHNESSLNAGSHERPPAGTSTTGEVHDPRATSTLEPAIHVAAPHPKCEVGCTLSLEEGARILGIPKGTRPDPSEYLSVAYIADHLERFRQGASRIMSKENFDAYGIGQRDGTSFVVPSREIDAMLASVGGDKRLLEKSLGLNQHFLEDHVVMRIDIPRPHELGLRVPSGNEAGANAQWVPGGMLHDGAREAIIDARGLPPNRISVHALFDEGG